MKLPKLHLRDLFWLVLVCALGCAWWMDRRAIALREASVIDEESRLQDEQKKFKAKAKELSEEAVSLFRLTQELDERRREMGLPPATVRWND
jgi:hypothetical protein